MSTDGPPWYGVREDGSTDYIGVPERLLRHPDIQRLGIVLTDPLSRPGTVFHNPRAGDRPQYVVKVLDLNTEELAIYERLLRDIGCPRNHTVPSEISYHEHPISIMPYLTCVRDFWRGRSPPLCTILRLFYDLIEGVEYLHDKHIAHLDLCPDNVLFARPEDAAAHSVLVPSRGYIIDFNTSRQFSLGPGAQTAITLPDTQVPPPDDITEFDPYSWDIHCLGFAIEFYLRNHRASGPGARREYPTARWYAKWLLGKERGCSGACRCRPTARTARQVLGFLLFIAPVSDFCERVYQRLFRPIP